VAVRSRRGQETVVGAVFFLVLVFTSLYAFLQLEDQYVLYSRAVQRSQQLAFERQNQKFSVAEANAAEIASNLYRVGFEVSNEGAQPMLIVNAYLYNASSRGLSRYAMDLWVYPGTTEYVNLTAYNASFPSLFRTGFYNLSLWTSLGVGSSLQFFAGSSSSVSAVIGAGGNVYPAPSSLHLSGIITDFLWYNGGNQHDGYAEDGVTYANMTLTLLNENPTSVVIYPNSSVIMYWVPSATTAYQEYDNSASSYTAYAPPGGVIGVGVNLTSGNITVAPYSSVSLTFRKYEILFYQPPLYLENNYYNSPPKLYQTLAVLGYGLPDIYVPIPPVVGTHYEFYVRFLLSFDLNNQTYIVNLNGAYANVTVYQLAP